MNRFADGWRDGKRLRRFSNACVPKPHVAAIPLRLSSNYQMPLSPLCVTARRRRHPVSWNSSVSLRSGGDEQLTVRSQLASREPLLNDDDKMMLEQLDLELLQSANDVSMRISEVANLAEMRKRAHVLPSHWWWYLDQMQTGQRKATA